MRYETTTATRYALVLEDSHDQRLTLLAFCEDLLRVHPYHWTRAIVV